MSAPGAKTTEEALREAEERARLLLDSATDYAILTLDGQGRITSWNIGAEALFGWTADEVSGRHFEMLFTPDGRAAGAPALEISEATAAGRAEQEGWRERKDGSRFWGAGRLLPNRQGEGFLKILRDVTEQRRARELLELSESRFRTLADNMPQLAWMADENGDIVWFNRRWMEYTGLDGDTERTERLVVIHPDHRDRVSKGFLASLRAGKLWEDTFPLRGKDGEYRWFLSRAVPIGDPVEGQPARWFGTNTDITGQREVEAALAEEGRALETLNQTAAILSGELDLDRLIQSAVDAAVALTGAEFGAFFYNAIDKNGESYLLYALAGAPRSAFENYPMPRATAVFKPTFDGVGVVRSDDITKDPRYGKNAPYHGMPPGHLPVVSYLAAPVLSRSGEVLGGLFFGHSKPGVFDARMERLLVGVTAQAAVAIDNARLYTASQRELVERRRIETALRLSEARARTLHETIPQLVWTCLPDGRCDYLSPQWEVYTGQSASDQLGYAWLDLVVHPDDRQRTLEHWMGAVEGKHPYDIDYRIRRADGEYRWFKVRGEAIRHEDGAVEHWFGACTDIQDIVEARESQARSRAQLEAAIQARTAELREANALLLAEVAERQQAEEALHQAQKMEAIGQLTGGVAHDFNNLLTAITGNLELLQRRLAAGNHEVGRYVDGAMASARRAASLTQRLLAFSRRQALAPKAVDLGRLAADMEELIRRSLGEDIHVDLVVGQDLWRTWCDPNQMENALLNLTINARDAMPGGGTLMIATGNVTFDLPTHDLPAGDYVMLAVGDTGIGMSPEVIARAFDPFFTTKPIGQGTGLGLSQLYGFAKQSGGLAMIESELGKGATVRLYLPRYRGAAPAEEIEEALPVRAPGPSARREETVLVVEDEALVRGLVVQTLEEAGYRVVETIDAPQALARLPSLGRLDLLVTDVGLPGMNGRQLAELVRQARPGTPVLFMTGYAHNAAVGGEDLEPGMSLIDKPFAIDALAARVDAILGG